MFRTAVVAFCAFFSGCHATPSSDLDARESKRRTDIYAGSALLSTYSHVKRSADVLSYTGAPQAGCLSYGPYAQVKGLDVVLIPAIEFSAEFSPSTYDTCNKRDWKKKCVGWDTHADDHGLIVDVVGKANGEAFRTQKEFKNPSGRTIPRQSLAFDPMRFEGAQHLTDVEVRICGIVTHTLNAEIYNVTLEWVWDEEVCDDPVRCPSPEAVREFVRGLRDSLPVHTKSLIAHRSHYYLAKKSEHSVACLLHEAKSRAAMDDVVAEVTQRFANTFGKPYQPEAYDCSTRTALDIHAETCAVEDQSDVCLAVRSYLATSQWFLKQQEEVSRRLASETVRASGDLHAEVQAVFQEVHHAAMD